MRRRTIVAGVAALLAAPSICAAQQQTPRAPPGPGAGASQALLAGGAQDAIPLTPDMIRNLGKRLGDNRRAEEEVMTQFASPVSRRVNVAFTPGQTTSIILVVKGYPTAVSFFDKTGAPWPIEWDTNSNPAGAAGGTNCNASSGGGPAVAAVGFYVCTPVAGSNVLEISPSSLKPRGGQLVTLKGAPKPISFLLIGGGGTYDADLSVQVAERGPNAKGLPAQVAAPDTASPFLTAMLDGVPPAEAAPLSVSGVSPDDLRAWRVGDRVVIRTRYTLVSPEWLASENGSSGWARGLRARM